MYKLYFGSSVNLFVLMTQVVFFLSLTNVNAQDTLQLQEKESKLRIGNYVEIYSGVARFTNKNSGDRFYEEITKNCNAHQTKFRYSIGDQLSLEYPLNQNIIIQSGIGYLRKGFEMKYAFHMEDILASFRFEYNEGPVATTYKKYTYNYLCVPLMTYFTTGKKNNGLFIGTGIVTNFLVSAYQSNADRNEYMMSVLYYKTDQNFDLRTVNIDWQISAGIAFNMKERVSGRLGPFYRHDLSGINNSPVRYYIHSIGHSFAFYYKL